MGALARIVPFDRLDQMHLEREHVQVGGVADGRLVDAARTRRRAQAPRRTASPGDAAHLDDIGLHHAHARVDQVGERLKRRSLAGGAVMSAARDLAIALTW
jgi:hypothetical protein